MSQRTTPEAVAGLIEVAAGTSVDQYIEMASEIVDSIAVKDPTLGSVRLKSIETLLACHYYSLLDPQYVSKATGKSSATFNARDWWKEAVRLDTTGTLVEMEQGNPTMTINHLGLGYREGRAWWQR